MRPSEPTGARGARLALVALAVAGGVPSLACSKQVLIAVDPPRPEPCGGLAGADAAGCLLPPGLLDQLVGYWKLDEGAGATAHDSSGQGNNGSLIGVNVNSAWVAGKSGTGLELGGRGWVNVAPTTSIDGIVDQITVAGWVNLEGTIAVWGTALSRQIGSGMDQHYHLSLNADAKPSLFIMTDVDPNLPPVTAPQAVAPRTWVHLAGTYDGMNARLYVNGMLAGTQAEGGAFTPDTTPLIIGGNGNDATGVPTELFPGRIDEVMLYHRALSADEIFRLSAGALFSPPPPGVDAAVD